MNLVLGDVVETIYVVEDEDEDDEIKVGVSSTTYFGIYSDLLPTDHHEKVRDAFCSR